MQRDGKIKYLEITSEKCPEQEEEEQDVTYK